MIELVALVALAGLVVWGLGGAVARFGGGLLILAELGRLVLDGVTAHTLSLLAAGLGLWLFGHWHHAAKHQIWRHSLALRVFSLPVLHRLAPIATNHRPRSASNASMDA